MATTPTKARIEPDLTFTGTSVPTAPVDGAQSWRGHVGVDHRGCGQSTFDLGLPASGRNALQALLAFSALHEQVRRRRALASRQTGFDTISPATEFEAGEQFILDEVLQLVAERAVAITGADGLAIALAENNEIVLRASAGLIKPDVGARLDRDSAFSGACFRLAQIVRCDDTEIDPRVNLHACRRLGARSMVAVPLCGRRRVIGLLEAFSVETFGFNDSDVRSLELLAELILGALKPEDEDRFAQSAQVAATRLDTPGKVTPGKIASPAEQLSEPQLETAAASTLPDVKTSSQAAEAEAHRDEVHKAELHQDSVSASDKNLSSLGESASCKPVSSESVSHDSLSYDSAASTSAGEIGLLTPTSTAGVDRGAANPALTEAVAAETKIKETKVEEIKVEKAKAEETTVEKTTLPQTTPEKTSEPAVGAVLAEKHRPGVLLVLVLVVIASMLAVGLWWKLKNDQLSETLITPTDNGISKPAKTQASSKVEPAKPSTPADSASANGSAQQSPSDAVSPDTSRDASSDGQTLSEPANAVANSQGISAMPRVTGIRHWSSSDSSTVVLDLQDQVQYEAHRLTKPDRIYFDLHDTTLAPELSGKSIEVGDGLLNRIRVAQPESGMTRVVLETKGGSNFSVSLEPNPYRLVVQVRKIGADNRSRVDLFPDTGEAEPNKLAIVVAPPTQDDLQLRARVPKMRIALDAGHGGWDLGTIGRRGLLEKDLVLEIAQRLGKLLQSRLGSEVIFTRQDDNYVPLDERAALANQAQADLFVSIHANYSDLVSARGVETYYTNVFAAPGSREAEARDSGTANNGAANNDAANQNTPAVTLSSVELKEKVVQSRRLAASVQRSLYGTLSASNPGLRDRGIKEAGFVVLTETAMPGILAEVSFVSSPTDEQKLRSDGYREQIAEALYKGIARYAASSHGVKMASAAK